MMDELIVAAQSAAADECGTTTTTSSTTHGHHNNNDSAEASSTAMTKKKSDATTTTTTNTNTTTAGNNTSSRRYYPSFVRSGLYEEMVKQVVRKKLAKQRHLVLIKAIDATLLESLFQQMQKRHLFQPQTVIYNGGVANVPEWKISCYLEVMEGGIPTTAEPNVQLLQLYQPLLDAVNVIFMDWYRQQHACNNVVDPRVCRYSSSSSSSGKGKGGSVATSTTTSSTTTSNDDGTNHRRGSSSSSSSSKCCRRLMTFITRYTPRPGEEALLKVGNDDDVIC